MSGICGIWGTADPKSLIDTLAAMNRISGVGNDDLPALQFAANAGVAVQARFAGQDVFQDQRLLLACDTDLLNEEELSRGVQPGATLRTATLLAALYRRDGNRFVEKLRGGFSIILWDIVERRLVAAIDGFGIKRLAWYSDGKILAVASRADALRCAASELAINPRAIANLLNFSANLAPETIFSGVERLAPGTLLIASDARPATKRYWDMQYRTVNDGRASERHLSGELESILTESVSAHYSGRPVSGTGSFLSGGTDSSTIVGLMTRTAGAPVKAFSIGFVEPGFNELDYAELAAKAFAAEHYTYLVSARDCLESLPTIIRSLDEPFGNSSAIATYFCARLAAEHGVTRLLAGDGGDELFGGNERYATDKIFELYHSVPWPLRSALIDSLAALPINVSLTRKARNYIRRANMRGVERMLSFQFLRTHAAANIFEGDFLNSLDGYTVLDIPAGHYATAPAREHLDKLLYVDMKITLADNDLPKVTRMSELAGVQPRFPFLDRSVAEFSGRVPAALKVKGLQKRYLFKRAFRNLLPSEIIRKKKHGFGIPVALWMQSDKSIRELTHDTLLSPRTYQRGYFRREFVEELLRKHAAGGDIYYGDTLWTFLMLELWLRQVVDAPVRVGV